MRMPFQGLSKSLATCEIAILLDLHVLWLKGHLLRHEESNRLYNVGLKRTTDALLRPVALLLRRHAICTKALGILFVLLKICAQRRHCLRYSLLPPEGSCAVCKATARDGVAEARGPSGCSFVFQVLRRGQPCLRNSRARRSTHFSPAADKGLFRARRPYKYGWKSSIEQDIIPKGLNEDVIRFISSKKEEPEWLLEVCKLVERDPARIALIPLPALLCRILNNLCVFAAAATQCGPPLVPRSSVSRRIASG